MATGIYVEKIKFQWCFGVFTANICSSILLVLTCATEDTHRNDKVSGDVMCYGCSAHSGMEFPFWKLTPYIHPSLPFLPLILSSLHILLPFSLLFQLRRHFFEEPLFCGNKGKFHATEPIFPRREQRGPIRAFSGIYLIFGPSSYKREGWDLCGFSRWWQYIEKGRNVNEVRGNNRSDKGKLRRTWEVRRETNLKMLVGLGLANVELHPQSLPGLGIEDWASATSPAILGFFLWLPYLVHLWCDGFVLSSYTLFCYNLKMDEWMKT